MARSALGRGIDALIPRIKTELEPDGNIDNIDTGNVYLVPKAGGTRGIRAEFIPIGNVEPNPSQPRTEIDEIALRELAESIKLHGLLQPILVARKGDRFRIVAGERRWRAARLSGLTSIPAIIKEEEITPGDEFQLALIENLQREDLNPIEEAMAFKRLSDEHGMNQEQIASRVSRSRSAVANAMRLLSLPKEIILGLQEGKVKATQVRPLLNLDEAEAMRIYRKIITETLSVRTIEGIVSVKKGNGKRSKAEQDDSEAASEEKGLFPDTSDRLMRRLGRKVKIVGSEEKGQIRIEYYSRDDLLSVTDYLLGDQ